MHPGRKRKERAAAILPAFFKEEGLNFFRVQPCEDAGSAEINCSR